MRKKRARKEICNNKEEIKLSLADDTVYMKNPKECGKQQGMKMKYLDKSKISENLHSKKYKTSMKEISQLNKEMYRVHGLIQYCYEVCPLQIDPKIK